MKKILFIIMLMPIVVFGADVCEIEKDTQTADKRTLTCDAEKRTTTTYRTSNEVTVLRNSVCTIKCTENIVFSVDPIKKVLAGTSFNYPLYASGERKCKATYNYNAYETTIRRLVSEYASLTGSQKATKRNEIINYYAEKQACDEFTKEGSDYENRYTYDGNVTLRIETLTSEVNVPYEFKETEDYDSNVITDEINYTSACVFNDTSITCTNSNKTINSWSQTVRIFGKYTMKDTYVQKYSGDIKNSYSNDTCNAGDRYFTSLTELTRPTSNNTTDKGYRLTITARDLGNNLTSNGNTWDLGVTCYYQVKNLMFPQGNNGGTVDDNYDDYDGTAFQYRIIDLDNPFPGREPGANWKGHEDIISSTKNNLSSLQRFVINLSRSSINRIREYNDTNSYDTFNLNEMEKSPFIQANPNIIDRK